MQTQQRVELKYGHGDDKPKGTVSKVFWDGSFRVSFDTTYDDKHRKIRGGRYTYKAAQASGFTVLS